MSQFSHLYKTAAWQQRRREQLRRFPLCAYCERDGRVTAANTVDHVVPHRGDLRLFAGALQSLCASCHSSRKQQEEVSGRVRGCDASGWPLDPAHHWNQVNQKPAGAHGRDGATEPLPSAQSASLDLADGSDDANRAWAGTLDAQGGERSDRPSRLRPSEPQIFPAE